ncbi:MAG TPA: hypothetical protein PK867_17670 [Pirellulales bacterium]|nr:hypothetical protein [Pirellulales bacterium]
MLSEFSLDQEKSAMSRLKALLDEGFQKINLALGVKEATARDGAQARP